MFISPFCRCCHESESHILFLCCLDVGIPSELLGEMTKLLYRYNPINSEWFDSEIYATFYGQNVRASANEPLLAHRLSVLFMILAIGSLMNTTLPAYSIDAEKYHQLSRAALFHDNFMDNPTLSAIQALVSDKLVICQVDLLAH